LRLLALVALLLGLCPTACQRESSPPPSERAAPQPESAAQASVAVPVPTVAAASEEEVDEDELVLFAEGDPEEGTAPLTVRFTVESLLEGEMKGPKYAWDFGDGSPVSAEASPTHTYTQPGLYTVTIRIVDSEGQRGWDEIEIEVEAAG
jgi:hypothetical protein